MDSRLLATLNAQAVGTRDPVLWAKTVCRAASHFARLGKSEEALTSIGVVRAQFGTELHHEVASWLMLAEGVLHYFQLQPRESYDRIRRAYGLALALKTESALPSCAAWMAHFEFNECLYEKMALHLEEALTLARQDDHQALGRAALIMADAYHLAGDYPLARPWYEKARLSAAAEGDDATLSAMLYNMAAYRASNARFADSFGIGAPKEAHRAAMETASSLHYDHAIGTLGMVFLLTMLRGLVLTVERKYAEALDIFLGIDLEKIPKRMRATVLCDMAWCNLNLEAPDRAWSLAALAADKLADVADDDDIAYVASRISQVAAGCGRTGDAEKYRERAEVALAEHRLFQTALIARLNKIRAA